MSDGDANNPFKKNHKESVKDNIFDIEMEQSNGNMAPALTNDGRNSLEKSEQFTFETKEEETLTKRRRRKKKQSQPYILLLSLVIATIYIIGALLYINNMQGNGTETLDMFTIVVALLGPAAFSVLSGILGESIARANRDSRALTIAAKRLFEPDRMLVDGVKSKIGSVRDEIERLENSITSATNRLTGLESLIEGQNKSLRQVTDEARGGADQLVNTMEAEKARLAAILNGLSELNKSAQITARQATTGLDEKAALLSKAAEALSETSNLATNAAERAADKLDSAIGKAFGAASSLDEASGRGEQALARAHDLMVLARVSADKAVGGVSNAIDYLHDAANNAAETAKQVSELVAQENDNMRQNGINTIEEIRAIAEKSAHQVVAALQLEAEQARQKAQESIAAFEATSHSIKQLTEEAGNLIASQLQANKHRVENLRQQSFELGQEADNFAQNRLNSARDLINQSSDLLNDAGEKIQTRFTEVAENCFAQAQNVEEIISGLNNKLEALPVEAEARARAVEAALSQTLSNLNQAGQKAAQEAQGLNDSFQHRLQESYAALGEVAQRLAAISGLSVPKPAFSPLNISSTPDAIPPQEAIKVAPNNSPTLPINATPPINPAEGIKNVDNSIKQTPQTNSPVRPTFGSVLSPNTPVRSMPLGDTNTSAPKINEPKTATENKPETSKPVDTPLPRPTFVLRGRNHVEDVEDSATTISQVDNKDNKDHSFPIEKVENGKAASSAKLATQEIAPRTADNGISEPTKKSDPFVVDLGPPILDSTRDWSWREVLSSSDNSKHIDAQSLKSEIVDEFGLGRILNDAVLERYLQNYARNPARAISQTKSNLPNQLNALRRKMAENLEVRPFLVRFVEERRELVKLGRLRGDDLRVYLLADAALDV